MPDVTNSATRKYLSELIKAYGTFADTFGINYYFATVDVKGTTTIDPIGTPLVYDATTSAFNVFIAQDITAVTGSPLAAAFPVCITVGTKEGKGFSKEDVTLSATATKMTVLVRGDASIANDGVEWGSANATNQGLFKTQLEKQGMNIMDSATDVVPSHITA